MYKYEKYDPEIGLVSKTIDTMVLMCGYILIKLTIYIIYESQPLTTKGLKIDSKKQLFKL